MLWFGASISIAEILTGALLAPLGMSQGFTAILIGHAIGLSILALAGFVGALSGLSTAQALVISFGKNGSRFFSSLNIIQLVGWASVMTITGAKVLNGLTFTLAGYQNEALWCLGIGALNLVWVLLGLKHIFKVNIIVVSSLFLTSLVLGHTVFSDTGGVQAISDTLNFGAAVELNVAMALSWLPLISDYTRNLKRPVSGTVSCVLCYGLGSTLMFTIGLGAAIYAGTTDLGQILLAAGFGVFALVVIIFSTLTTTFMDTYSVGVNASIMYGRMGAKAYGALTCLAATSIALLVPMSQYENFLYLIGSVFAPLFAILLTEFFLYGRRDAESLFRRGNFLIWLAGFVAYRLLIDYSGIIGNTLPVMLGTAVLCWSVNKVSARAKA
jgi:putative hydroxymethylpyrimidine transporter CytX